MHCNVKQQEKQPQYAASKLMSMSSAVNKIYSQKKRMIVKLNCFLWHMNLRFNAQLLRARL